MASSGSSNNAPLGGLPATPAYEAGPAPFRDARTTGSIFTHEKPPTEADLIQRAPSLDPTSKFGAPTSETTLTHEAPSSPERLTPTLAITEAGLPYDPKRAAAAESHEKTVSFKDAFREDKFVLFASLVYSGTIIMEGYGMAVIFYQFSNESFLEAYGEPRGGGWEIGSQWYMAISFSTILGPLAGVLLASPLVKHFGYHKLTAICLLAGMATLYMVWKAQSIQLFTAGLYLQCVPWGVFQVVSPAFISEVSSLKLRPILTTWNNLCWVIGQTIAAGVALGFSTVKGSSSFRTPIGLLWPFSACLILALLFAPESPCWHLRQGDVPAARVAAAKLWGPGERSLAKVDLLLSTIDHEERTAAGLRDEESAGKRRNCACGKLRLDAFRGIDRKRTVIACAVWLIQTITGHSLTSWGVKLFEGAGLDAEKAFMINFAIPMLGLLGTMSSWWLMQKAGRRTLYFGGVVGQFFLLILAGSTSFIPDKRVSGWVTGSLIAVFNLVYALTLGPVCYTIVSEIPSLRLRTVSMALARSIYMVGNLVNQVIAAQFLHPDRLNWGSQTAYLYAGSCIFAAVFIWFCLPETKGLTARQIDELFEELERKKK